MSLDCQEKAGLAVTALSHAFGNKTVLDDVSFSVEKGQFCALLGPNGAGKSTLFALLTRLLVSQKGTIRIAGINLLNGPRQALARIGIVFQQPTLDLDLTVRQNLAYFAALHGIDGARASDGINLSLQHLDMKERANEKVRALNGGHRRRMEIARALIHKPSVLLLDEPTVGLDAGTRKAITDHVHALAKEQGITVLWATHLTDEVRPDDQLIVLHKGKIVAAGRCGEVTGDASLGQTFSSLTEGEVA